MDEENGETVTGKLNELNEAAVPQKELLDQVKELEE
jgi:hypothetical protein